MISITSERQSPYYCSNDRAMVAAPPALKVQSKYNIIHLLLCVLMMTNCVGAFPSPVVKQDKNRTVVVFNNQVCRPVDPQHLTQTMGNFFDRSKMALDEATVKRSIDDNLLQSDDPSVDSDDGLYSDDDSDDDDDELIDKSQISDKSSYIHKYTEDPKHPNYLKSIQFMRRKRDTENIESIDDSKNIYQKLMEAKGRERKPLKRQVRRKRKLKPKKKMPWTCKTKKVWLQMEEGYFPRFIRSAQCTSKKCFFNLNECIPKKYTVTILKRDPSNCNPVPSVGLNTTYEERWFFDTYHVTVYCECGRRRGRGGRKSRRS